MHLDGLDAGGDEDCIIVRDGVEYLRKLGTDYIYYEAEEPKE